MFFFRNKHQHISLNEGIRQISQEQYVKCYARVLVQLRMLTGPWHDPKDFFSW
jgi:hypothetical protein